MWVTKFGPGWKKAYDQVRLKLIYTALIVEANQTFPKIPAPEQKLDFWGPQFKQRLLELRIQIPHDKIVVSLNQFAQLENPWETLNDSVAKSRADLDKVRQTQLASVSAKQQLKALPGSLLNNHPDFQLGAELGELEAQRTHAPESETRRLKLGAGFASMGLSLGLPIVGQQALNCGLSAVGVPYQVAPFPVWSVFKQQGLHTLANTALSNPSVVHRLAHFFGGKLEWLSTLDSLVHMAIQVGSICLGHPDFPKYAVFIFVLATYITSKLVKLIPATHQTLRGIAHTALFGWVRHGLEQVIPPPTPCETARNTLGLSPDAPASDIGQAYREAAKPIHPDHCHPSDKAACQEAFHHLVQAKKTAEACTENTPSNPSFLRWVLRGARALVAKVFS